MRPGPAGQAEVALIHLGAVRQDMVSSGSGHIQEDGRIDAKLGAERVGERPLSCKAIQPVLEIWVKTIFTPQPTEIRPFFSFCEICGTEQSRALHTNPGLHPHFLHFRGIPFSISPSSGQESSGQGS